MKLVPLKKQWPDTLAATIRIRCHVTKETKAWNDAVAAGWQADSEGKPFDSYYSPEGIKALSIG